MLLNILFLAVLIISLIFIGLIVFRKFPQLRTLDIETVKEELASRVREKILLERMRRSTQRGKELLKKGTPIFSKVFSGTKNLFRKVYDLEKEYEKKQFTGKTNRVEMRNHINALIEEGINLMKAERYSEAEKIFIEVISIDHKNVQAYKHLGDVYMSLKEYKQALQTFEFILKIELKNGKPISKTDEKGNSYKSMSNATELAAIYHDIGYVYRRLEKLNKALDSYTLARDMEPNNPRHLDEIIEISIMLKDKILAYETTKRLEQVNPDNQKVKEYFHKISEM